MDKGKVKFILIALAGLVVLFMIYKLVSKKVDSKLEADNKVTQAAADLEVEKMNDEYEAEVMEAIRGGESAKNELLAEKQIAEGVNTLADYKATLTADEKEEYDLLSSKYIDVTKVSPGLMTLGDLRLWNDKYSAWSDALAKYVYFGGDASKISFLNEKTDEAIEIESIIHNSLIPERDQMYQDEYETFLNGSELLANIVTLSDVKKWLFNPSNLRGFKEELKALYTDWTGIQAKSVTKLWNQFYEHFDQMKYVDRKSSGNIIRFNNLPDGILSQMKALTPNGVAYLNKIVNDNGILIPTQVKSNELKGKSKDRMTSITDILQGVASCRAQWHDKSSKAYEQYMWQNYKDARAISQSCPIAQYTPYGMTKSELKARFIQFAIDCQDDLTENDIQELLTTDKSISDIYMEL